MNNPTPTYSIVIPAYKSGSWMDELVIRIGAAMEPEAPTAFELILVNDCSPDAETWPAIQRNAAQYPWVRGFNLLYNVGQFRATLCGLQEARGRFVITMDDDLQHPPEELPKLIRAINGNEDALCVMGTYQNRQHGWIRRAGSHFYQRMIHSFYGCPPQVQRSSFRIMRKELADAILACRTAKPILGAIILSLTPKVVAVPVQHAPRDQGRSGYSLRKLVGTTLDNVINASTAPLRFFSVIGFTASGASLLVAAYYSIRWLTGGILVPGYASQILLISFLGGLTLMGIGVLGEYIARIIYEITGPERYRIKEQTDER